MLVIHIIEGRIYVSVECERPMRRVEAEELRSLLEKYTK